MEGNKIEEEIIRKFIAKERQSRFLWEFRSQRKRSSVFWHFAGSNVFKSECLHPVAYMTSDKMRKWLLQHSGSKDVYFIGESYIGALSLDEAVTKAQYGEICIIYCGKGTGYYQGEPENGKTPRFLLLSQA